MLWNAITQTPPKNALYNGKKCHDEVMAVQDHDKVTKLYNYIVYVTYTLNHKVNVKTV